MKTFLEIIKEKEESGNYGIFCPPITGQEAIDILTDYLLGEDWYTANPVCTEQVNTEIVAEILWKYSDKYRREVAAIKRDKNPSKLRRFLQWLSKRV